MNVKLKNWVSRSVHFVVRDRTGESFKISFKSMFRSG